MRSRVTFFFTFVLVVIIIATSQGIFVSAQNAGDILKSEEKQLPQNPLHSCNMGSGTVSQSTTSGFFSPLYSSGSVSEDVGLWDYVYFGSYPQSEVTDIDIITEIERVISEGSISKNEIGKEPGADVSVDGIKYRRITKEDRNYKKDYESNSFGTATYRYFKWEPIKWKVLQNDGKSLFLITDQAIDCKNYNETEGPVTWETCDLRNWLNTNFYLSAFDEGEQSAIIEQNLVNEDNAYEYTDGGNDTTDKVYLLSISDISNPVYGYCSNPMVGSASRWQQVSDYTFARGAYTYSSNNTGENKNGWWWIRTPGETQEKVIKISDDGNVGIIGNWCENPTTSICPAVKVDLLSQEWTLADDGSSGEGKILTDLKATIIRADYSLGTAINTDDLRVTATYSFCSKSYDVALLKGCYTTNEAELDMDTPGEKTLTVTYSDRGVTKTADVKITVKDSGYHGTTNPDSENGNNTGTGIETENGNNTGISTETGSGNNTGTGTGTGSGNNTGTGTGTGSGNNTGTGTETENGNNSETAPDTKIQVTKLKIFAPSKKLAVGKKVKLTLTIFPENASNKEIKWNTSNKNYATVDKNGKVTLKAKGVGKKVTITAEAKDGSGVKSSYKLTIMKHAVKGIKIKSSSKTLKAGSSMKLNASIKTTGKKANTTLKWTSSNTNYATVTKYGKVKAKKAGKGKTVTITAASTDGSSKKAKIKIKIM